MIRSALPVFVCCASFIAADQNPPPLFGTTVVIPSGLRGLVYLIPKNTLKLPEFDALQAIGAIYTNSLNITPRNFKEGFPGVTKRFEWFAIDYAGRFWIEHAGLYRFRLTSDDGARLYIDGQLIADDDRQHEPETREASLKLSTGIHRIRVSYFEGPRFQVALVLEVAKPGEVFQIFSTDEFKPPSNPENWSPLP